MTVIVIMLVFGESAYVAVQLSSLLLATTRSVVLTTGIGLSGNRGTSLSRKSRCLLLSYGRATNLRQQWHWIQRVRSMVSMRWSFEALLGLPPTSMPCVFV